MACLNSLPTLSLRIILPLHRALLQVYLANADGLNEAMFTNVMTSAGDPCPSQRIDPLCSHFRTAP